LPAAAENSAPNLFLYLQTFPIARQVLEQPPRVLCFLLVISEVLQPAMACWGLSRFVMARAYTTALGMNQNQSPTFSFFSFPLRIISGYNTRVCNEFKTFFFLVLYLELHDPKQK